MTQNNSCNQNIINNSVETQSATPFVTSVGVGALANASPGANCAAVGYNALNVSTGSNCTAVGYGASTSNTSGVDIVSVGY